MSDASGKTVLIVDDDISVSEYLEVAIRSAGHRTLVAYDGQEALEKFERENPDLVVLDALIPKKDGFEVCRSIKKTDRGRRVPVVMMTGIYTKRSYREDALHRAGAVEYIVKPFGISEIWRILKDHLGVEAGKRPAKEEKILAKIGAEGEVDQGLRSFFERGEMRLGEGVPFSQRPIAITLRDLHRQRKTGLLFLRCEKWTSIFYFDRGDIVFVRSNDVALRLDRVLVKMNKITEAQYNKAQQLFKDHRGKHRMGEILTGMKIITHEELEEGLRFQLQLLIARVFQWRDGTAYFVEGDLPDQEELVVRVDTRAIIFTGVKNMRGHDVIREHLPADRVVLRKGRRAEAAADAVGLTAFERQILSVVDGTKTVRQIRSMGQLANVEIDALLFAMLCTGLLQEDKATSSLMVDQEVEEEEREKPRRRAFKGDFSTRPLPYLLRNLHAGRKTGVLTVQHKGLRKWLQVERGEVIFAGSDDPDDRIGRVLVRANLISEDDLEAALGATAHREGKRIGRVLVDQGHITLEELYWAVVFQVQRIVTGLFAWREGTYLFREGPLPTRETIILELNTMNLILEGVRSIPEDLLHERVPLETTRVERDPHWKDKAQPLGLSSVESSILESVRGAMSCQDLVGGDLERHRAVYALGSVGLLQIETPEAQPADLASEELAVASGGGGPATTSGPAGPRPGPHPNPPIPFPNQGSGPEAPNEKDEDDAVPRFLYEELVAERRELEDQILELYSDTCDLEMRLKQAAGQVRDILHGGSKSLRRGDLEELLAILDTDGQPEG